MSGSDDYGKKGVVTDDFDGFRTSGFINKKGTPSGEGAKFNKLPPGDDITNQEVMDMAGPGREGMPYKEITTRGYQDSGAFGNTGPKDVVTQKYNK
jgi:hypothetical protein